MELIYKNKSHSIHQLNRQAAMAFILSDIICELSEKCRHLTSFLSGIYNYLKYKYFHINFINRSCLFKSKPESIDWRSLQNANYEKDT